MKETYEFLKKCGTFYLATVENNQPRVRPFGAINLFEDKIYMQTCKVKNVSKQIEKNNKIELYGFINREWIRVEAKAIRDERIEAKVAMLEENPSLKSMYSAEEENTEVLYLEDVTSTIYSFTNEPITYNF